MIETKALTKKFGGVTAVDNVTLSVQPGEVLGFLGPNGAGKSTTMKMITGFLSPTSGSAAVCGMDVAEKPLEVKRRIGYLPEGAPLYPDMTPESFLGFIAEIHGLRGANAKRRVEEVIERVNLGGMRHKPIETLSKGYKRRVGLAQAIVNDPPVLILDEPTDGLDPNQKHEVRSLIQDMSKDKVIVLSTHILEEVDAVCSRATIISKGRVVIDCTPRELMARSRFHNAVSMRMKASAENGAKNELEGLEGVAEVQEQADEGMVNYMIFPREGRSIVEQISERARSRSWQVDEIAVQQGRLDEVFRNLTNPREEILS